MDNSSLAFWTANSLFNAGGFLATLSSWDVLYTHRYKRLLWLIPSVLLAAWLASSIIMDSSSHPYSMPFKQVGVNLFAYLTLSFAVVLIRKFRIIKLPMPPAYNNISKNRLENITDSAFINIIEKFLVYADTGEVAALINLYADGFECIRIADKGGFIQMNRTEMIAFWNKYVPKQNKMENNNSGKETIPLKNTVIHHAEIINDSTGIVLMTRIKNLGSGWEPMFYCLLWQKVENEWRLLREFVHQKSIPNF